MTAASWTSQGAPPRVKRRRDTRKSPSDTFRADELGLTMRLRPGSEKSPRFDDGGIPAEPTDSLRIM